MGGNGYAALSRCWALLWSRASAQHRLLEQLQRELLVTSGAAANAESAAVCLNVGSDPDGVVAVAVDLNLPAEQTKPEVENLAVRPCGRRHRTPFPAAWAEEASSPFSPRNGREGPAASGTLTIAHILRQPRLPQLSLERWFTYPLHRLSPSPSPSRSGVIPEHWPRRASFPLLGSVT